MLSLRKCKILLQESTVKRYAKNPNWTREQDEGTLNFLEALLRAEYPDDWNEIPASHHLDKDPSYHSYAGILAHNTWRSFGTIVKIKENAKGDSALEEQRLKEAFLSSDVMVYVPVNDQVREEIFQEALQRYRQIEARQS